MTHDLALEALDIFDPSSYPTRRDEAWKYSDLSRALRVMPKKLKITVESFVSEPMMGTFRYFSAGEGEYTGLQSAADKAKGRLLIDQSEFGSHDEDCPAGVQGRGAFELADGQVLVLFEDYSGAFHYASNTTLDIKLGEGASLTRVVILDEPEDAVSIRRSTVTTAPGSTFKQYVFSSGAKFQRFETHVEHAGHDAKVELHGAYLLNGKRHFDLTTRINHAEGNGQTEQLIKGLVKDQATAVFQGRIRVERGADGTDARMRHQALMLNDGAHIRAKPELEIYADDVQCAHGNTIGALDQDALFFCQSRGMDDATARALLTQAFILPVADLIEDEELRAIVLKFLEDQAEAFHAV